MCIVYESNVTYRLTVESLLAARLWILRPAILGTIDDLGVWRQSLPEELFSHTNHVFLHLVSRPRVCRQFRP